MASCEQCGETLDETASFCGVCGAFTAWGRTQADPVAAPSVSAPSLVQEPVLVPVAAPAEGGDGGGKSNGDAGTVAAADLTTVLATPPTTSGPVGADQPAAVQPGLPSLERGARPPAADQYVAGPDDVLCEACQSPNPADRRFCRRCGASLASAVAPARERWWRRLVGRVVAWRRRRRLARRRGVWGAATRVLGWLLVLGVIGAGVELLRPHAAALFGTVRGHFASPVPIVPQAVTASSGAPGHPAALAADGAANTWWSPAGAADGQWLQASFAADFTLLDVTILSGASEQQNLYLLEARPATFELTAWTAHGATVTRQIKLEDKPGPQQFPFLIPGVDRIRLTVESTYGAQPGRLTALAEVQFFSES